MSTTSIDFRFIVENDNTPLIVFDHEGHILYPNAAAEIVLGYVSPKELFELTLLHAPKDYGSKTTLMDIHYRQLFFYAINVAYKSDDWIALRLYYRPRPADDVKLDKNQLIETNINMLLEATLSMFKMKYGQKLSLIVDQEIPEFRIDQNGFSRLLRKAMESFRLSGDVRVSLSMTIGESIVIDDEKYHVIRLKISANGRFPDEDSTIARIAQSMKIVAVLDENEMQFDIPLIS